VLFTRKYSACRKNIALKAFIELQRSARINPKYIKTTLTLGSWKEVGVNIGTATSSVMDFPVGQPQLVVSNASARSVEPPAALKQSSSSTMTTEQAVKQVNDAFLQKQQSLIAAIEKDQLTGISVFKIKDINTNEVVRQLPTKAGISFAQSLAVPEGWRGQLILDQI
jgi:uncharacterized FlaG/YvyC family protein